jgi:hypothetical protein
MKGRGACPTDADTDWPLATDVLPLSLLTRTTPSKVVSVVLPQATRSAMLQIQANSERVQLIAGPEKA